jgi:arylsulfatase A-like enzyme
MKINRRDFLKLSSLLPASGMPIHFAGPRSSSKQQGLPNILVSVFDAFSGSNTSLYGYPRQTTPLIQTLAERAIVYHNHYTGGSFTSPGTASLLTGTLPWTHRVINPSDRVFDTVVDKNIFNYFGDSYYRIAYSHNYLADDVIRQFISYLDQHVPRQKLFLVTDRITDLFINDFDIAFIASKRAYEDYDLKVNNTIYLPDIYKKIFERKIKKYLDEYGEQFPLGIPNIRGQYYLLEDAIDWLLENITAFPQPYLGYFHFFPPHQPYSTRRDFYNLHDDDYSPLVKPNHPIIVDSHVPAEELARVRQQYDEFLNYVDFEFDRLYRSFESKGVLDNTWIVLTSDHGEMFERGIQGHIGYTLHQPLTHIPLLIFPPGGQARIDVRTNTSAIDILPTIMQITSHQIPDWSEGKVLPPFGAGEDYEARPIICVQGKGNNPRKPFTQGTVMLIEGKNKMNYYFGYKKIPEGNELIELYDLEADPEEMNNLYSEDMPLARSMRQQIIDRLELENAPFR